MTGAVQSTAPTQEVQAASGEGMNIGMEASTQALNMATAPFEDAAMQLLSDMAAITGIGQNLDIRV
jgi:hypothetical protein